MKLYDFLIGKKIKVTTDMKVEVELVIKSIEKIPHSREITPSTRENDWYGETQNWSTYRITFENGAKKEYDNLEQIDFL